MGAAPNYALTQYFFRLYQIKLSTNGYFTLRDQMRNNDRLIECTLDEVAIGTTADGAKTLTIQAIYDDFHNDRGALKQALEEMKPSYINRYLFNDKKDGLIFSIENNILRATSGKEKPLLTTLNTEQKSLLLALAAHGKGLTITPLDSNTVDFHEFGWIEIHDEMLQQQLEQLAELLRQSGFAILEITRPNYFRVSMLPELIFFDYDFFRHRVEAIGTPSTSKKWRVTIYRNSIETCLGNVHECSEYEDIACKPNRTTSDGDSAESAGERIFSLSEIMKRSDYLTIDDMEWRKLHPFLKNNEEFIKDTRKSPLIFQPMGLKDLLIKKDVPQHKFSTIRERVFLSCLPLTNDVDGAGG
jgi:hypothetical protein